MGLETGAASLAMKSKGSKITWVVPSRYGAFSTYLTLPLRVSDSPRQGAPLTERGVCSRRPTSHRCTSRNRHRQTFSLLGHRRAAASSAS